MKLALKTACTVAALALALPVAAQTTAQQNSRTREMNEHNDKAVTITGCLQRNDSGGFWLTNAKMSSKANEPTGTSGSATASSATTAESSKEASASNTWNLKNGHDLDKYVGHKIEVTGTPQHSTRGDTMKGTTGTTEHEIQARDIDVKTVKSVASTCS